MVDARRAAAARLEADVARRVKAGEMAPSDLNLARQETLSARAAVLAREAEVRKARQVWTLLTGERDLPSDAAEVPAASSAAEPSVALEAARRAVEAAQAHVTAARVSGERAELSLGIRRERTIAEEPYDDTVALACASPSVAVPTGARRWPPPRAN
jgi:outer membrane protein TolC